uniref:CMP/dCMP-type deaminase domain-containing protein n=1 Tax=viral metagenome TaxID=1070528 RepID=A0A6C0DRC3_9ZZZZ
MSMTDQTRTINILRRFAIHPDTVRLGFEEISYVHKAIIVKRGHILAEAGNKPGNRSKGSGYSERSIHAEKHVVKQLGDISKLRGADMYVVRTNPRGTRFLASKPCHACEEFLLKCMKEYGLNNVYYTT